MNHNSPMMSDQDLPEAVKKYLASPKFKQSTAIIQQLTVQSILTQEFSCEGGKVTVTRREDVFDITWRLNKRIFPDPNLCMVIVETTTQDMVPDPQNLTGAFYSKFPRGDLAISIKLDEGGIYLFRISFNSVTAEGSAYEVSFHAGVPLSPEKRKAVHKMTMAQLKPEESMRLDIAQITEKTAAFYKEYDGGVKAIKALGLSAELEAVELARFEDQLNMLREKYGI